MDRALVLIPFGRHLLIAISRPGRLPANLQGIWNESLTSPWESQYTININTEWNDWPAEMTNLAARHEPLFDLIEAVRPSGRQRCTNADVCWFSVNGTERRCSLS